MLTTALLWYLRKRKQRKALKEKEEAEGKLENGTRQEKKKLGALALQDNRNDKKKQHLVVNEV